MRKQTKLVAVLSAAALLALGASMTSFAATGWVEENGTWVYYDNDGYKVTDTWKKSVNNWFWLNSDGEMAVSTIVEDEDNYYYVDENGAMVSNTWVQVENEDADGEDEPAYVWYYFQANGKAYKAGTSGTSFKPINGKKYAFDSEGQMLYGWIDDQSNRVTGDDAWQNGTYYCGDENDGAQRTSWDQIHVIDVTEDEEDQDYWFYFGSNGKKVKAEANDNDRATKTINGQKYVFDSNGKMLSGWVNGMSTTSVIASPDAVAAPYRNFSAETAGNMKKGWFQAVPDEDVNRDAYDDEEAKWYYAKNDGTLYNSTIKTINGKKYAFNEKGEMLSGLVAVQYNAANSEITNYVVIDTEAELNDFASFEASRTDNFAWDVYYFGASSDGSMKLGNQNVEVDGETYGFFFTKTGSKKGQGFGSDNNNNGVDNYIEDGAIYVHGRKAKADSDMKYEAFTADGKKQANGTTDAYLVNTSGSIMKKKKNVKDGNDMYICTDENGKIKYYDELKCGSTGAPSCGYHQ